MGFGVPQAKPQFRVGSRRSYSNPEQTTAQCPSCSMKSRLKLIGNRARAICERFLYSGANEKLLHKEPRRVVQSSWCCFARMNEGASTRCMRHTGTAAGARQKKRFKGNGFFSF